MNKKIYFSALVFLLSPILFHAFATRNYKHINPGDCGFRAYINDSYYMVGQPCYANDRYWILDRSDGSAANLSLTLMDEDGMIGAAKGMEFYGYADSYEVMQHIYEQDFPYVYASYSDAVVSIGQFDLDAPVEIVFGSFPLLSLEKQGADFYQIDPYGGLHSEDFVWTQLFASFVQKFAYFWSYVGLFFLGLVGLLESILRYIWKNRKKKLVKKK